MIGIKGLLALSYYLRQWCPIRWKENLTFWGRWESASLIILIDTTELFSKDVLAIQTLPAVCEWARFPVSTPTTSNLCIAHNCGCRLGSFFSLYTECLLWLRSCLDFLLWNCLFPSFAQFYLSVCRNFLDIRDLSYEAHISFPVYLWSFNVNCGCFYHRKHFMFLTLHAYLLLYEKGRFSHSKVKQLSLKFFYNINGWVLCV